MHSLPAPQELLAKISFRREVGILTMLLFLAVSAAFAEVTVRVRHTPGGPQIFVDGEAVPPRFFFGSPGGGAVVIAAPDTWQSVSFEFTPNRDVDQRGTLHFRFPKKACRIQLRNLRVVDCQSGRDVLPVGTLATKDAFEDTWNLFPPGEKNNVGTVEIADGAVHLTLAEPPGKNWPDFHLHSNIRLSFENRRAYRCGFEVKCSVAGEIHPAFYCVEGGVWNFLAGPPGPLLRQIGLARDAGVRLLSTSMPACWQPPDEPENWEGIDTIMREIIDVHPSALIVPRVSANAPPWWLERHPETRMMFENGKPGRMSTVSSRIYRREVSAHMEKLNGHLCRAFPDHFAGIHPAGQNSAEWFYDESWGPVVSGYEPPTREAWRSWLKTRGEPSADLAEIPAAKRRHDAPYGFLLNPEHQRDLVLFNRFWQQEMADTVVEIAAACRRGTGSKKLVVFFYGYLFEFPPLRNGAPYSGHYALSRVLASSDIDVLCSPISYFDRQWQATGASMTAAESVALHGKLWLNEDDTRTYLARTTDYGGVADLPQTKAVLVRNTAQAALRGFGTWWMDLPGKGWFDDARLWDEHRRLAPLDAAMLDRKAPFQPEIALILGEESMIHLTGGSSPMARPLVYEARAAFGRSGAPYGQYMLRDAISGDVPARLQVFLAAWSLTPDQRRRLRENRPAGTTRVWCYAPGYLLADRADVGVMSDVSGFEHRALELDSAVATPTPAGKALGLEAHWGQETGIRPLFTVVPAEGDQILATYGDGSPAVVLRTSQTGADIFTGVPAWTSQVARALAKAEGVHLYTTVDANVWAAEGYLSIHTMSDGPLQVNTGSAGPVEDAFTGARLGDGPAISLETKAGETHVLKMAEVVMKPSTKPSNNSSSVSQTLSTAVFGFPAAAAATELVRIGPGNRESCRRSMGSCRAPRRILVSNLR